MKNILIKFYFFSPTATLLSALVIFITSPSHAKCKDLPRSTYAPVFRSHHISMNKNYVFTVHERELCIKRRTPEARWHQAPVLPEMQNTIKEIAVDGTQMVARGQNNRIFFLNKAEKRPDEFNWTANWGVPFGFGDGLSLPADVTSWDFSYLDPKKDKSYTDSAGQDHIIGVGVTSLYAARGDRQTINYFDPWLPGDLSYEVCGPMRGRLRVESLSAAGSTLAVMDQFGNIFVRRHDFDIVGGDIIIIGYTYKTKKPVDNFLYWLRSPRKLPVPDWEKLPRIDGIITNKMSIKKVGQGAKVRFIRVEGIKNSRTGYFEARYDFIERSPDLHTDLKPIRWRFVETNLPLEGKLLNISANTRALDLGPSKDQEFVFTDDNKALFEKIVLENFNTHCSPSIMRVDFAGTKEPLELMVHSRERIRISRRSELDLDRPLLQTGAIEIPKYILKSFDSLPSEHQDFIRRYLDKDRFTKINLAISPRSVEMQFGFVLRRHVWQFSKS